MKTIFQSENGEVFDDHFIAKDIGLLMRDMAKEIERLQSEKTALKNERDELLERDRYR